MLEIQNDHLYEALCKACSQNPVDIKDAEQRIQELEIISGYSINLFNIINNYSLNADIRCMAGLCLKNAVDKYWRKAAVNSIKDEERTILKTNFLTCLNEPDLKIARQLSVIAGKIARYDVPSQWTDLLPNLIRVLQETSANLSIQNNLILHNRCLMVLHQVIKSLSSKRLYNDRRIFEEMSQNLINIIPNLAFNYIQKCLIDDEPNATLYNLDQAILCLKIIDKLVLHGFKDTVDNEALNQLMLNLLTSFDRIIAKYKLIQTNEYYKEKYEYLGVLYVNILNNYHETYPFNFVSYMSDSLKLIINICFTQEGKQISYEKLLINLMNFLKSIIMCDKYKQSVIKNDNQKIREQQQKAIEIRRQCFTQFYLKQILVFMFNNYLLMTLDELEIWCSSEEEFMNEDGTSADAWKYNFRACIETLFQAFVHEFNELVVPIIFDFLNKFSTFDQTSNTVNAAVPYQIKPLIEHIKSAQNIDLIQYLLLKDVAYNCASISAWELMTQIDFDVWFSHNLINEIRDPNCNDLIKRRILILISNWVNIKLSSQYRPSVYEIICNCLQSTQNLVIRLQATITLRCVLDDVHFEKDVYLPYLNSHFGLLCDLLKQVGECDTKIKVLSVLSFIVERVDIHIRPYSAQLADYLPFLWNESQDYNMLRCSIVTALTHLVKSFGAQSVNYHTFLIPIIHYSTDTLNVASVYLLEDGLELWNITVQNSVQLTPQLLELFSNLKNLLERDSEIWKSCLDIVDAYVVLDAHQLFQYYSDFLTNKFCDLFTDSIKIEALLRLMRSVGLMFEIPKLKLTIFEPFILKAIDLALNPETYPMIMAMCLNMLAKPVLDDCQEFMNIIGKCAMMHNLSPEKLLSDLLDSWIDKIDMIVHPEKRKLTALALTSLLRYNSNVVYERFGAIMNINVMVMLDILKEDNGVKYDCLVMSKQVEEDDEEIDTEHEKRKRRLRLCNLVYSVSLKDYCIEKFRECEQINGTEQFQKLIASVDKNVMQKLNEILSS